jgi:hypothetical protein
MKRLLICFLLAAVGTSGCFWGMRGHGRGEGPRREEHRGHEGDRHEGEHGHDNDHRGEYDHR